MLIAIARHFSVPINCCFSRRGGQFSKGRNVSHPPLIATLFGMHKNHLQCHEKNARRMKLVATKGQRKELSTGRAKKIVVINIH